jgi:hypothetical protein
MLTRRAWLLTAALGWLARPGTAWADGAEGLRLELTAPEVLSAGDRATITASLFIPGGREAPVLLTPTVEGTAVEVVRGRLTRADAEHAADGLRFAIPIAAHMEGIAVLRVRAQTFACTPGCHAAEAEARLTLRVRRGALARPRVL